MEERRARSCDGCKPVNFPAQLVFVLCWKFQDHRQELIYGGPIHKQPGIVDMTMVMIKDAKRHTWQWHSNDNTEKINTVGVVDRE